MFRRVLSVLLLSLLSACSTPGAFFEAVDGDPFTPLRATDARHALVYLYRPQNQWADEELEAPGLFLGGTLIGSLPSNGYLVLEFEPGRFKLEMRRPLLGGFWTLLAGGPLDFNRIASFEFETRPGHVYYLRYDESRLPPKHAQVPGAGDGPLQLVNATLGQEEIVHTRQVQAPRRFTASGHEVRAERHFWQAIGQALGQVGI